MSGWPPAPKTQATREAAEWLLGEMRGDLADAETLDEVAEIVARHAGRVSNVVLDLVCTMTGARAGLLVDAPTAPVLIRRIVTAEYRRLGLTP